MRNPVKLLVLKLERQVSGLSILKFFIWYARDKIKNIEINIKYLSIFIKKNKIKINKTHKL